MSHFTDAELYDITFRVCVAAVKSAFPHLPMAKIIDPPRGQFDAVLARQIALHVMVAQFDLPKKRAGAFVDRARVSVNRALQVIDDRLDEPEFATVYRRIAAEAQAMFDEKLAEAA